MKIDPQSYSACNGELPPLCASLIETIKGATTVERFIEELNRARDLQAVLGKTELSRWADVLNRCDEILEDATVIQDHEMKVDRCGFTKYNTISILRFTGLLFDCTSTRRIYASTDRIIRLTECTDMDLVGEVLRLLQTISKRSKFLTQRLCPEDQASLVMSLTAMAQCWGGKLRNLKMEDCVHSDVKLPPLFPFTFTDSKAKHTMVFERHMVDQPLLKVVDEFAKGMTPEDRYSLLARIRMLRHFEVREHRMQCLIVRLLSISTLIYCRCQPDDVQISALLYSGFIEEAVALLKVDLNSHELMDPIQTEALRMLCSVVSLEKASRTSQILDVLSAGSYHGFLAVFTRNIVEDMKRNALNTPGKPSVALSTALLSFIYHLSNNDPGGETLAACGLTQTLLSVISHHALPLDQATLATRCTRITDNFTTIDVTGFNNCKGMDICIDRLIYEVDECRKEQPFVIDTSGDVDDDSVGSVFVRAPVIGKTCHPQRSGLIKALITFIKRAIQDTQFQDSVRHIMEGQLPDALMHIISNSEYYSASLYHHATQLVVNFIYQEPAQLTVLQNRHVPYVILQSMLRKELPNSRDVISHMGNVFTALCLNEKGLKQFKAYAPFDHVFNIVLSIKFIVTMKKKRSEMNEAAQGIGSSLDDLLRHQPTLKPLMLNSVLGMLDRLVELGNNPPPNTKIVMALSRSASKAASQSFGSGSNTPNVEQLPMSPPEIEEMSDDDDEAEMSMDELSGVGQCIADKMGLEMDCPSDAKDGTRLLPLGDYLLIFTKIFEAIITQVAAADLVEGFVEKNGVEKILSLCNLPSLAADLAASTFSASVGCIVKFVLQHVKAGDKLMLSIMEVFLQSINPFVLRTSRGYSESNGGGASLLVPLGDEGIVTAITSMSNAVPILSMLTKNNSLSVPGTQGDLRNRVWDAWLTDTGKRLHTGFRKVSRVLAWETALLKMIEPTKAVATTQTDPSEIEALSVGTSAPISHSPSEPNNVMSVAVDPPATAARQPAWAMAGITQAENAFWHRHKNVADMVIKANKTVSEFLSQLSRSCFVPTRRNRRYDFSASTMTKSAQQMADEVFAGFFRDLKWTCYKVPEGGPIPPMEFGRLQEVIVQMSVALFDDRRQPFHAMLQRFYTSGCHNAFCDLMMNKLAPALGNDYNDWLELAFLEWFRLASKLAHKQNMLHSMYRQPQPLTIEFDPKKYLKLVHNDFFRAFCVLFAKLSDEKVDLKCCQTLCETAISVYKDVAHSLTPVSEDNQRAPNDELNDPLRAQAAEGEESQRDAVLRQLLPEGSVSLLVDMGFPHELVVQALEETGSTEGATEWLINRNAAGLQQVILRLWLFFKLLNLRFLSNIALIWQSLERSNDVGDLEEGEFVDANLPFLLGVAVSSSSGTSDERDARRAAGTSSSVDAEDSVEMPIITPLKELNIDTDLSISRACIELMPLCKRLMELGSDLVFSCADLVSGMVSTLDEEWRRRHLIGQIMTEEIITMAQSVMSGPSEHAVRVLSTRIHFACLLFDYVADEYLEASASQPMVSTMLLLLGFVYDNFDVDYMQNGKEKDYTVDFTLMKQNDGLACHQAVFAELPDGAEIDIETLMKSERESVWTTAETSRLLIIVVSLLHKSLIHHTAAHTILAFVARLTRDSNCAANFIQQGGIAAVLQLRCSTTPSTSVLTSLIIRQCIDDENMMAQVMEKSVRVVTNPVQSTPLSEYLGMSENKPKDWCETLNKLSPLSTRAPAIFVNTMEKCAKLDGTLMVSTSSKPHFSAPTSNERTQQIVQLLLRECLHGEWPSESSVPLGHTRMISRGAILSLLAELVKSYPGVASLICEAKEDGQSVIHQLIEHFIDGSQEKDTLGSLKTLISILAACNHSPKAQESLVSDMKASLVAVGNSSLSSSAICSKAVINAAVADAVRIPSPSNSRDAALSHAIDLGLLANNLLSDARELSTEQDDRNDQMLVRVSDNAYLSDNDQPQENDHHRSEVMDEEMDEEAVEDSMSSGEEDNEDRTVEDEEGDDREEDDTMDGEDQDDEEEEDDEDGRREGDVQATVRVDAEESGEDGEEEEEDDDEEMYDYPEEDEDALHDMTFDLLDRPGLSSFGFDDFIFGPPIGINREHRGARREQSSAGVHPLMVRPAHIADSQPSHNQQSAPTLGNYRSLLLDSGNAGIPVTLTRQNALRRIGGADRGRVGPTSQFFDRLFDLHARDRGGPLMNMTAGRIVSMGSNLLDSPEERRMRQPASAPSALDRYTDGADMMDGVSMQYVAIIINTIVTRVARKRVEEEKAKEAAEQAAKKLLEESSKGTSESAPKANEETGSSAATATVLAHPPTEVARQAWDESALANRAEDVNTAMSTGDSVANGDTPCLPVVEGEAMDTSEAFEPRDVEADVSMDEAPPHSSAATVASSLPEAEADEERMITPPLPAVSNVNNVGEETRDASDRSDNSGHTETTTDEPLTNGNAARAATENNSIPEEIREILGDIEIPDGVDPAFLAALPEDMRAEVIRDHRRQQRAQRAAQVPATVPQQGDGSGEGASNVVPIVEPLDQEFLAALPPELQEEILAQHERAVRDAEEAVRRANAPAPPAAPEPEMDGAAVIASLPPHERTQVLAEMEESELQRLPTEMQEEARRARANLEPLQNILRFRHLLMPSSARSRGLRSNVNLAGFGGGFGGMGASGSHGAGSSGTPSVGSLAGQANTASTQSLQLLDRDSILILTMLFLVDSRLSNGRLQKLVSVCPSWLDSITVSGVGHNERALKIAKNVSRVAIHPLLSPGLSKNVLDSLGTIAKTYPGHFLPSSLRKTSQQAQSKEGASESSPAPVRDASPPLEVFWELVQASSCKSLAAKEARESAERMSLESSHMGRLMRHLSKNLVAQNGQVQDRLLRVISSIVQTLPNDTMALLGNLEGPKPLESQLKAVIDVLMRGSCSNEGLADGRTLLVECMRALPPSITDTIYEQLFTAVQNVGLELQPQIERLIEELGEPETNAVTEDVPSTSKAPPTTSNADSNAADASIERDRRLARTRIGRLVLDAESGGRFTLSASSCPELQLPAVTMLTDKSGAQYKLLSALQTLSKIRDTMRQMKEERRKKEELEKKKKEEEAKAAEAKQSGEAKTIDPVAVEEPVAATSDTSDPAAAPEGSTPMSTSTSVNNEDQPKPPVEESNEDVVLSHRLTGLEELWEVVSTCLLRLGKASDHHAVLALQPAAEAFFLVHAVPRPANVTSDHHHDDPDTLKMIAFAEKHREVLNQVLRQNNSALSPGGPFAALIQFPKLLDFDVKRKYFRKELGKMDGDRGFRRSDVQVQVRRSQIFSDSFRELYRLRPNEWKHRFYIIFQGEEGQDAGGLLREWFSVITREIFNPNYALFITAPGDMVTYMINKASYINPEHLDYFKFVGRLIAKAIYDNKLLDCYFTRAFYKHILNLPVRYQDIESEDPAFYKSLEFLLNNPIDDLGLDLSFSLEVEEFGVRSIRDLKPDGRKIDVTDANKEEYVKLVCQMKMTGSIRKQLDAFLTGFYEVIPKQLISMFNEQELELLISGLPDVDIDDLSNNTEYKMYTKTSAQIQWFWRALRSFEPEDRAKFLQFVTGTSKVPLQGFASLEGMNGIQKFSIHMDCRGGDRLPAAHTCFNQLDLPQYESYEKLRDSLLMAIRECTEGFGFA
ncbi:unnamed protein product [Haemonchus placei]|uniref:HECT-type E3 ubiquitin transferase n=1 Tax=Haemonchus placei TaxID=6290 RepID=A0A158QM31_HAEPC|nr:unnamed protein product [Haemonchus placei]